MSKVRIKNIYEDTSDQIVKESLLSKIKRDLKNEEHTNIREILFPEVKIRKD